MAVPSSEQEHRSRPLLWFCVAGAAGYVVDVAVLLALQQALGVYGARALSFLAAATMTWLLNRSLAFSGRSPGVSLWAEYLRYVGLMIVGGTVNYMLYSLLAWRLPHTALLLAVYVGVGSLGGMVVNFVGSSRWLYRKREPL